MPKPAITDKGDYRANFCGLGAIEGSSDARVVSVRISASCVMRLLAPDELVLCDRALLLNCHGTALERRHIGLLLERLERRSLERAFQCAEGVLLFLDQRRRCQAYPTANIFYLPFSTRQIGY